MENADVRWLPTLLLALIAGLAPTAALATFEEGHDAFTQGKYAVAMELWSAAASNGDTRAINNLAYMYANGIHVPRDLAKAVSLYRQAVDLNRDPYAMTNLGWSLLNGFGTDRDVQIFLNLLYGTILIHFLPSIRF